ncbi:MAG: DNA polymerase III subunit alpha [Enterobacteriaceae bacterium PSpicST2]|nr:MAG: DNA polymerase III subunit alpha [Enterobacteriaceae bacterium PSpicST2]
MYNKKFIHLHIHSNYSLVDSIIKINNLIKEAKKLNYNSLALTDINCFYGILKFYKFAYKFKIKPIIGTDFYIKNLNGKISQLTILASNNKGYKNLKLLITKIYEKGYNNLLGPIINYNLLKKYKNGLIILSGSCYGDIGQLILQKKYDQINYTLDFYQKFFLNKYYLEITRTNRKYEENYINKIISISKSRDLPIVATNDVCFLNKNDYKAHKIRLNVNNLNIKKYSKYQFLRSEKEMCKLFKDIPEALINSVEISKSCNVVIKFKKHFIPFLINKKISSSKYLNIITKKKLEKKIKYIYYNNKKCIIKRSQYYKRLKKELKIINKVKFSNYFLIISKFVKWAKNKKILVGPGRGSGAGSLVAFLLNIIDINPVKYNLIFERFLNPERILMPDFDIDFCIEKRDKVINYVKSIYGYKSVAQIITFGTLTARAAIRDVGRILGYSYNFVDYIAKLVPTDLGITLNKALYSEPLFLKIYQENVEAKELIDMSLKLEGIIKNISKHAGGIVISPSKITNFTPLFFDSNGKNPMTQFDKTDIESIGLIKFDFLGLKTLTIIDSTLKLINLNSNIKKKINLSKLFLDDKKSYNLLKYANTVAIFQLESIGMKDLIRKIKPNCFNDIIDLIALFRPGPLKSGMVQNYINRKYGIEKIYYPDIKYEHKSLKPILKSTYGIILYQEQIIEITKILSEYTLGSADILLRSMNKKNNKNIITEKKKFVYGSIKKGINKKLSNKIFDLLYKFAGYGFNKSHSVAYSFISYQTLWLKTYYPSEFMACVMTAEMQNTKKLIILINECKRMKINILYPNINKSFYNFSVDGNKNIIWGIGAIKGIGKSSIDYIIKLRNKNLKFKDLFNFCMFTNIKKINKRILKKLIFSGAFDFTNQNRSFLKYTLNDIIKITEYYKKYIKIGQKSIFNLLNDTKILINNKYKNFIPLSKQLILEKERDALGLYLTDHPINQYIEEIKYYTGGILLKDLNLTIKNKIKVISGLLIYYKIICTKNNKYICICIIDDQTYRIEVILYNNIFKKNKNIIKKNNILIISGEIFFDNFKNNYKIIAYEIFNINKIREKYINKLIIFLNINKINNKLLCYLYKLFKTNKRGKTRICFYYKKNDLIIKLICNKIWNIKINNLLLNELREYFGYSNIKLSFNN